MIGECAIGEAPLASFRSVDVAGVPPARRSAAGSGGAVSRSSGASGGSRSAAAGSAGSRTAGARRKD